MPLKKMLFFLDQLYNIHETFANKLETACHRGCASCCTRNVTMTTLEGYKIIEFLISNKNENFLDRLEDEIKYPAFRPTITINRLAEYCMQGIDIPDEENNPSSGCCPFLQDSECLFYPVRPFGCRCFFSKKPCKEIGYADIDPLTITVNSMFLQYIEHIDSNGVSGNLADILYFMASADNRKKYMDRKLLSSNNGLISNQPIRFLMIPPEHRTAVQALIDAIGRIKFE